MLATILTWLAGFLPSLTGLAAQFETAWFNSKVAITQAKVGGDAAVATQIMIAAQQADIQQANKLKTISGSALLTWLVILFAAPLVIFEWKVIVYDIVLGWGTTDPIRGEVKDWATTIIASLFGSATVLSLARVATQLISRNA